MIDPRSLLEAGALPLGNEEFLQGVFGEQDWPRAHVCSFAEDPYDLDSLGLRHYWAGGPARTLLGAMTEDQNQYFTISLFEGPRRRKAQHDATYCIVLDDVGTGQTAKVPWDKVKLSPSWVLETSPGNYQVGYILRTPEERGGKVAALLEAMVATGLCSGGKDPGMKGVTRYVRLPGGTNTKKVYGEGGFRHRMLLWKPEVKISLEQIAIAYGVRAELDQAPDDLAGVYSGTVKAEPGKDKWLDSLMNAGKVKQEGSAGVWDIECPFMDEHTARADTGSAYLGGGNFKCHHGHCESRSSSEFQEKIRADHPTEYDEAFRAEIDRDFGDIGGSRDPFEGLRTGVSKQLASIVKRANQGKFASVFSLGKLASGVPAPQANKNWLMKHLFPAKGLGVLFGAPKTGKSFVAFDLAARIALGILWNGHLPKRKGFAVYVSSEGGGQAAELRAWAWCQKHQVKASDAERMLVFPGTVKMGGAGSGDVDEFVAWVREHSRVTGEDCILVILDTLNRNMVGDENSTEDMTGFVNDAEKIWRCLQNFVLIVHHSGKDAMRGPRGSSVLQGALDAELEVKRDKAAGISAPGEIHLTNLRHAEDGKSYGFQLERVDAGADEDGEAYGSLVAVPSSVKPTSGKKLTPVEAELRNFVEQRAEFAPEGRLDPESLLKEFRKQTRREPNKVRPILKRLILRRHLRGDFDCPAPWIALPEPEDAS